MPDTDIFGFRFAKFFARAVFVHVRLPIKFFDIGVSVGDQNLFFGRCDERADILQIRVRKSRAALDADQVRADKGHVFARLFRRDLVLFHVGDHFPVFEFDDAVGVRFSEFPIVRNDEDEFIFGKFFQRIENLPPRCRIERARRFVRHDDLGFLDERAGDRDALFLSARKGIRLALCKVFQLHRAQNFLDFFPVFRLALQFEGERDVRFHRKFV